MRLWLGPTQFLRWSIKLREPRWRMLVSRGGKDIRNRRGNGHWEKWSGPESEWSESSDDHWLFICRSSSCIGPRPCLRWKDAVNGGPHFFFTHASQVHLSLRMDIYISIKSYALRYFIHDKRSTYTAWAPKILSWDHSLLVTLNMSHEGKILPTLAHLTLAHLGSI